MPPARGSVPRAGGPSHPGAKHGPAHDRATDPDTPGPVLVLSFQSFPHPGMTPRPKVSAIYPDLLGICLLRGLSEEEQRGFLDACTLRHHCEETALLTQSEHTAGFYLVARGRVVVSFLDVEGNLSVIHVAGPGEIMGDVECLSDTPCAATCTSALSPCAV